MNALCSGFTESVRGIKSFVFDFAAYLEHGVLQMNMNGRQYSSSALSEQRAWALTLGTLFFALLSYWLVGVSIAPSAQISEVALVLRSILSADAAWFVLLGWILTTSFYLGFSRWPVFFARFTHWPRAARTVAWKRFRSSLWASLCLSLAVVVVLRRLGVLSVSNPGFDLRFLVSEFHLLTDPLASFILLFLLLDVIRNDLFAHAFHSEYASAITLVVTVGVEAWVWLEYLGDGVGLEWSVPLILAVLWGALKTYEALIRGSLGAAWHRFGWAVGIFVVFDLGLSLMDSRWSSGWSFYVAEVHDPIILLACVSLFLAGGNVAVLHRFSKSLTRAD